MRSFDNGGPHKPPFPKNELLENVKKRGDSGILPSSLLQDRFNVERKSRDASSCGISPESSFEDKPKDSSGWELGPVEVVVGEVEILERG